MFSIMYIILYTCIILYYIILYYIILYYTMLYIERFLRTFNNLFICMLQVLLLKKIIYVKLFII